MAYDALAIANYFLARAEAENKHLTPMAVQKLVYFAHGWHLALTTRPLITQRVQAWEFGPVIPAVYHAFKKYGKSSIKEKAKRVFSDQEEYSDLLEFSTFSDEREVKFEPHDEKVEPILDRIWEVYKNFSAIQLSNITHLDNSPWDQVRKQNSANARGCIISDEIIADWFKQQAMKNATPGTRTGS